MNSLLGGPEGLKLDLERPVMFLDFDGVLNPLIYEEVWIGEGRPTDLDYILKDRAKWGYRVHEVDDSTHYAPDVEGKATHQEREYVVRWSTELVGVFNRFIDQYGLQVVWLSTWRQDAGEQLGRLLGLNIPEHSWLTFNDSSNANYTDGKLSALQRTVDWYVKNQGKFPPFVWVDDQETFMFNDAGDEFTYFTEDVVRQPAENVLLVSPEGRSALSRSEMEAVEAFLGRNRI